MVMLEDWASTRITQVSTSDSAKRSIGVDIFLSATL
jgi:hypothetical protein